VRTVKLIVAIFNYEQLSIGAKPLNLKNWENIKIKLKN
tara:strand:- start:8488 stop:8601 length:114 start_codon:yes stop_codon:yes gene_type:complete